MTDINKDESLKPEEDEILEGGKVENPEQETVKTPVVEEPQTSPEEVEKLKKAKDDILQQLIEERKRRQIAEAKVIPQVNIEEDEPSDNDTEKEVLNILKKKEDEQTNKNRVLALEKFWKEHPQYSPSNDLAGLNMDRIKDVLDTRINTLHSQTVDEIYSNYQDALMIIGQPTSSEKSQVDNSIASTPSNVGGSPTISKVDNGLSSDEKRIAKESGMSEDKFKRLKEKYPDVVS